MAWAFVLAQAVLIAAVVLWPGGDDWPVSRPVAVLCTTGSVVGIVAMLAAAAALGRGLTAAPLPNARARLRTGGAYRFVRHPIYTGLLLFTLAQVVPSRDWWCAGAGVALVVLISAKATWEETRLRRRFDGYADYARRTPRFVPGWPVR